MSNRVWWSRRAAKSPIGEEMQRDAFVVDSYGPQGIVSQELDDLLVDELFKMNGLPDDLMPNRMIAYKNIEPSLRRDEAGNRLSAFFMTQGLYFVANEGLKIFEHFDLGKTVMRSVEFIEHDGEIIDEPVKLLLPIEIADNFDVEGSPNVVRHMSGPGTKKRPIANFAMEDDDVLLKSVYSGKSHLWMEYRFQKTFFVSNELANALHANKLAGTFELIKARVADNDPFDASNGIRRI